MACENRLDDRKIGSAGKRVDDVRGADRRRERRAGAAEHAGRDRRSGRSTRGRSSRSTTSAPRTPSRRGAISGSTPATARRMDEDGFVYFVDRMKDCDPPARREHLVVGDRVDDQHAPGRARVGRVRRPVRADRVGGDGRGRARSRARARARGAARLLPRQDGRTSRCRATSASWTRSRRTTPSGCRSSSSATRASPATRWDREAHGYKVRR